jgi:hypothetical protein
MKRSSFLVLAVALAANAHADPIVTFTQFTETIVYSTNTFETSRGAVLDTVRFVGGGDETSDIASEIDSRSLKGFDGPVDDPAVIAFIK